MQNENINTNQPIISLTVNLNEVSLSVNERHLSALLQSGEFDSNIRARLDSLQALFKDTYDIAKGLYAAILAEIYLDISTEEVSPVSHSTRYFINGDEEENNEA